MVEPPAMSIPNRTGKPTVTGLCRKVHIVDMAHRIVAVMPPSTTIWAAFT
jgi:hypothetical protein